MGYVQEGVTYNVAASLGTVASPTMTAIGAGHSLWIFVACVAVTGTTCVITDNASGNTYSALDSLFNSGIGFKAFTFKAANVQNGPTVFTATFNAARTFRTIIVVEVSGYGDIDSAGAHALAFFNAGGSGANAVTTGNYTTTQNGCYIISTYFDYDGGVCTAGTSPLTFTQRDATGAAYGTEDAVQTTASSSTAGTWTNAVGTNRVFVGSVAFAPPFVPLVGAFEDTRSRRPLFARRSIHPEISREEFLFNPTQTMFTPWGFEEESKSRRTPPRMAWRGRPEPLRDEFLLNPTQTVFANWGFDEEQHRQERRIFHRAVQQEDPLGLGQLVGVPWSFEEEPSRAVPRRSRSRPNLRPDDSEGLPFTAATPLTWVDIEQQGRRSVRVSVRWTQPDDLLPVTVAAPYVWGFDEEPQRAVPRLPRWRPHPADLLGFAYQAVGTETIYYDEEPQRAVSRARVRRPGWQEDPLNPPVVSVEPWAFDSDPRRPILVSRQLRNDERTEGLPFTAATPVNWPDIDEPPKLRRQSLWRRQAVEEFLFNPTQISFASWGFEEEARRRARTVFRRPVAPDEYLFNPTQVAFVAWGFDEEQRRLQRRIFHRLVSQDDPLPLAVAASYAWGFEEEPQRAVPRLPRRKPRTDDILGFAYQVVGTETIYYEEEPQRAVPRARVWHAHPQPNDLLSTAVAAPVVYIEWGDEPQRLRPRRFFFDRPRPRPDEIAGFPFIVLPPSQIWGWEQLDQRRALWMPRRGIWRGRIDDDWLLPFIPIPPIPPPPLTQPDGRWRSVIAPGESSINDNNYLSPVIGEVGFALFFDTTVAFSSLIEAMTLVFTKPSGNQLSVEYPGFFFGADRVAGNLSIQQGFVGYIFGPGDLDEAGLWSVFLARGGSRASGIAHFRVLNLIEGLESARMT
jgi:hypothetical protein